MLIHNPELRQFKSEKKHEKILRFLRDETWSSPKVIAQVIRLSEASAYKTLNQLIDRGWIAKYKFEEIGYFLYGITTAGLMQSWSYTASNPISRSIFQPSKVKPLMVQHYLMTQEARIRAEHSGWTEWIPGKLLHKDLLKRPDAVARSENGVSVAVEIERTIKTVKRYEAIFSNYLQAIKRGECDEVHYVVPDDGFAANLQRLFGLIEHVPVAGKRVPITDKHKAKFKVFALADWPKLI